MKNDKRILELTKQIEAKRKAIGPARRFEPVTNCHLKLDGDTFNFYTLAGEPLTYLLVRLNSLRLSADDLGVELPMSGYKLQDWIVDLKARLAHLNAKGELKRLAALEKQLETLLSSDKQTELAVDAIADLI